MGRVMGRLSPNLRLVLLWLVFLVFPFAVPNDYIVNLGAMFFLNVILIASLNLLVGYGGQISLGHGGFYGLGAYISGVLAAKFSFSPWISGTLALAATCVVALLIGLPTLRLRGHYLAMATVGFNAILIVLFSQLVSLTGGPNGLTGVPSFSLGDFALNTDFRFFFLSWCCGLAVMLVSFNVIDSRFGRGLRALSGSEMAAECFGVNTYLCKLLVFILSAAMAALAGVLYVHYANFASPESFSFFVSVLLLVMVALGGMGSAWGPIVGALLYTAIPELLRAVENLEIFAFGASMILVLLFFPRGIGGGIAHVWDLVARRAGARE